MEPYYEDDHATIYHGDCRELLPFQSRPDLVVTDPPYSAATHDNAKSNKGGGSGRKAIDFQAIDFQAIDFQAIVDILQLANSARWSILTCDFRHAARFETDAADGLDFVRVGAWVKSNPMPQISADRPAAGWEAIAYLHASGIRKSWHGGGCHGNFVLPVDHSVSHPTSKPLAMARTFVERFSDPGDVVFAVSRSVSS